MSRNLEPLQRAEEERQRVLLHVDGSAEPVTQTVVQDSPEDQNTEPRNLDPREPLAIFAELDLLTRRQVVNAAQRLFLGNQRCKTVVFSSVEPRAGCTWIAARVASALAAHVVGSVCLVDSNIHSPGLHQLFRAPNHLGFADAMAGSDPLQNFVQQTSSPNLWLLPCRSPQNGHSVLRTENLPTRMKQLTSEFEYVIIDAPPVTLYNDAITIAGLADGLVLVLRANSSRREAAQKALQDANAANVRVLGAILNQRTYPIPEIIYKRL